MEIMMVKNILLSFGLGIVLAGCGSSASTDQRALVDRADVPYLKGESKTLIVAKPDTAKNTRWFTNDHCFVKDKEGTLHWFGINNPYPPKGKDLYRYHPYLGHCTAKSVEGEWKREPWAIDESKDSEYLGAPFVVWHEESGRWVMVVETWRETRRLDVYWSDDLYNWESKHNYILPEKLWIGTRDPHIMKGDDGKYWIHVVCTGNKGVKQSQVIRIKTKDFEHFEDPETIMGINDCEWATLMESPFVYKHNDLWYLFFTYAHRRYAETVVVVSDNPNHFDYEKNTIATLFGHAAEIVECDGKAYITTCGPEDEHFLNTHDVTVSELKWAKQ